MSITFKTATDFRKSLETRIQSLAVKTGEDLQRMRRKVAFDRFLARIFSQETPGFYLKGGYAMELRTAAARATKDIDLTCIRRIKNENDLLAEIIWSDLQLLARIDLKDHFVYQIGRASLDLENAPYGGARYPVVCLIDGKSFVRFHLDVGADFLLDRVEMINGPGWLEFCGISAPAIQIISIEQQFAEKLHAYTLPRGDRENSRSKDLIDMVLLLKIRMPNPKDIAQAVQKVFEKRNTHVLPSILNPPPESWNIPFSTMATECGLSQDMKTAFRTVSDFFYQMPLNGIHTQ